jgi:hypothetical protein
MGGAVLNWTIKNYLKTAVWLEKKAVHHYGALLNAIEWDEDLRRIIKEDGSDGDEHVSRWKRLLDRS